MSRLWKSACFILSHWIQPASPGHFTTLSQTDVSNSLSLTWSAFKSEENNFYILVVVLKKWAPSWSHAHLSDLAAVFSDFSWNFLSLTQSLPAVSQAHHVNMSITRMMTTSVMTTPPSTLLWLYEMAPALSDSHLVLQQRKTISVISRPCLMYSSERILLLGLSSMTLPLRETRMIETSSIIDTEYKAA